MENFWLNHTRLEIFRRSSQFPNLGHFWRLWLTNKMISSFTNWAITMNRSLVRWQFHAASKKKSCLFFFQFHALLGQRHFFNPLRFDILKLHKSALYIFIGGFLMIRCFSDSLSLWTTTRKKFDRDILIRLFRMGAKKTSWLYVTIIKCYLIAIVDFRVPVHCMILSFDITKINVNDRRHCHTRWVNFHYVLRMCACVCDTLCNKSKWTAKALTNCRI